MLFTFLVGILLARKLGTENFGRYTLVMSIISILLIPSQSGLSSLVVREVSKLKALGRLSLLTGLVRWSRLFNAKVSISLLILSTLIVLMNGKLNFLSPNIMSNYSTLVFLGLLCLPLLGRLAIDSALIRGNGNVIFGQSLDSLLYPVTFFFILFFTSFILDGEMTSEVAMAARLVTILLVVVIASIYIEKKLGVIHYYRATNSEKLIWKNNLIPLALADGIRVFHSHFLTIALGAIVVLSDVAIFRVASSLLLLINLPLNVVSSIASPDISKLFSLNEYDKLETKLRYYTIIMMVPMLVGILFIILFGDFLILISFGSDYLGAKIPLLIMSCATCFSLVFGLGDVLLNMTGHSKIVLKSSIISLACMLVFSWPMIKYFGVNGAASLFAFSWLLFRFQLFIAGKRIYKFNISLLQTSATRHC
ncbi:polysaccharide biosynthesis C-terminal domain-containing protein [Pseudoalteromonas sp. Z9A6]|uniref:polysaccharide biosynthesis C-terminal domain-containing protein n=1 Tax=Pseudoalteromonas sp. Z9A6 TaxID=2686352 RepID=UPI0013FD4B65|nr:polysaccharide biosynthesis C-terminal domain-containing protein [Pseudoalteromonas sp. Z9A6]